MYIDRDRGEDMDPNAALKGIRDWLETRFGEMRGEDAVMGVLDEVRAHFDGLDEWLKRGGSLPKDWERSVPQLPDTFEPPPSVRGSDTSMGAAESVEDRAATMRRRVYALIFNAGKQGATCDELECQTGMRHQTASARVWELHTRDHIIDSGLRRKTRSKRDAIVWVAAPRGSAPPKQARLFP